MTSIKKMSVEELQNAINRANGYVTWYANGISKRELVNQFVALVNSGKIQ